MKKTKPKGFMELFALASVWFGAHVGGGFATGNQTTNFFVRYGWSGVWLPVFSMLIIGLVYREGLILARKKGTYDYHAWAVEMYSPSRKIMPIVFEVTWLIIVLLATGGSIAGGAALITELGIPYGIGVIFTGGLFFVLTIFGAGLVRRASSFITILLIVCLTYISAKGIPAGSETIAKVVTNRTMNVSYGKAIWEALCYAGFQSAVIAAVVSAAQNMHSDREINQTIGLGFVMNSVMIVLTCIMLTGFMPKVLNSTLPILDICKSLDSKPMVIVYSIGLYAAFISTGISCVFGAVTRFEGIVKKPLDIRKRRALLSFITMSLSVGISLAGLSNIVKIGYSYVGVASIFTIIIPVLVLGYIKNHKNKDKLPERDVN